MNHRILASLLALLLPILSGCAAEEGVKAPALLEPVGIRFDTAIVQRGDVREINSFSSSVSAPVTELFYEFDGKLAELSAIPGQKVRKGDVLFKLDVADAQSRLESLDDEIRYTRQCSELRLAQLQLELEICEIEFSQMPIPYPDDEEYGQLKKQELARKQTALEQEKKKQELQMDQLMEQRESLAQSIERSELIAPFDGTVVYVNSIHAGQSLQALQTQVVLMDESRFILSGDFVSDSYLKAAVELYGVVNGKRYELSPIPYDRQEYFSLVLSGRNMHSQFDLSGDLTALSLGDYATVFVVTREAKDVLYLPINALYRDGTGSYVYRNEGGERKRVPVVTGLQTETVVEIKEGLSEGDEIYVKE